VQDTISHGSPPARSTRSPREPIALAGDQLRLSGEELLEHLQLISGRTFRSREDVRAYVSALEGRANPAKRLWATVKQAMWLALLACAFLQYYAVDVLEEVSGLQSVDFHLPPPAEGATLYRS
jgi:hypothetical protein